jgi:hypothetical protein
LVCKDKELKVTKCSQARDENQQEMLSFTHYAKAARLKYTTGKRKEAIADYKEAINLLSLRIQQAFGNKNIPRNRYVKVCSWGEIKPTRFINHTF